MTESVTSESPGESSPPGDDFGEDRRRTPAQGRIFAGFLGSPILWGGVITAGFYVFLFSDVVQSPMMTRYFAGSKINYAEVGMFFVGLVALLMKWWDVSGQRNWMNRQLKNPGMRFLSKESGNFSFQDAAILLGKFRGLPAAAREGYFVSRLENTLDYVHRNQSAVGLEDEMKYLSDLDTERMSQGYSFTRLVVWAIPILGFLGTVVGITYAIGSLGGNLADTASTLPKMIEGLSIAFDTTAIALVFSIILMFMQYLIEKQETSLLSDVDYQIHRELSGRFDPIPDTLEGAVVAIRRVGEMVMDGLHKFASAQGRMWEESFRNVEGEWTRRMETLGSQMVNSLHQGMKHGGAEMGESLGLQLANQMGNAGTQIGAAVAAQLETRLTANLENQLKAQIVTIQELRKIMTDQCAEMHEAVTRNVESAVKNVEVISKSSEIFYHAGNQMEKTTHALTGATQMAKQVGEMEHVLAQNLSVLQGAKDFERTVAELSLAARTLTQWLEEVRGMRRAG